MFFENESREKSPLKIKPSIQKILPLLVKAKYPFAESKNIVFMEAVLEELIINEASKYDFLYDSLDEGDKEKYMKVMKALSKTFVSAEGE